MALYTTSLEVMVNNLCEDRTKPISERIESARGKIFDFDYPAPSTIAGEEFKRYFETAFINKYLFREIAQETVARFHQRLYSKTLEIMPKYKMLFDILDKLDENAFFDNYNFKETKKSEMNTKGSSEGTATGTSSGTSSSGSKSAGSNLPENMLASGTIGNFTNVNYADTANISNSNGQTSGKSDSKSKGSDERKTTNLDETIHTGRTISQFEALRALDNNFNEYFTDLLDEYKMLFLTLIY